MLYVPEESIKLYREAPGWKRFKNISSIESSGIDTTLAEESLPNYTIEKGAVNIDCKAGDIVEIYDLSGMLLERRHFEAPASYRYEGSGPRIVRINAKALKAIL